MAEYTLVAEHNGERAEEIIECRDSMSATIHAITIIIDKVSVDELWQFGEVRLIDAHGRTLREIPAKDKD